MYQYGRFRAGTARYQSVDIASRIEGATPHQLVQIMYEELLKALDQLQVPVEDQIGIIYELQKTGALHAEIIRE